MKKYIILTALLFSGIAFAQENDPKLEAIGELVRTTYYFENGKVQQEGFFKNGKLEGIWISFDINGNKLSVANYE